MQKAAKTLDYERAAELRDRIRALEAERLRALRDAASLGRAHRGAAADARRVPDEEREGPGALRGQGAEPARARALLLRRRRRRPRAGPEPRAPHRGRLRAAHAEREGGAAARERADQAAPAALQRAAARRQAVPRPAPRPAPDLAAPHAGAALRARRRALLRPVHLERRAAPVARAAAPDLPAALVQRGRVQGLRAARPALHRARDEALPGAVRGPGDDRRPIASCSPAPSCSCADAPRSWSRRSARAWRRPRRASATRRRRGCATASRRSRRRCCASRSSPTGASSATCSGSRAVAGRCSSRCSTCARGA